MQYREWLPVGVPKCYPCPSAQSRDVLDKPQRNMWSISFSPDGTTMAVAGHFAVYRWDITHRDPAQWRSLLSHLDGNELDVDGTPHKGICGVAYDGTGDRIAACTRHMHVGVCDAASGQLRWAVAATDSSMYKDRVAHTSVAWSHDSSRVVMGGVDGFRVYNAENGKRLYVLRTPRVYRVAVLPGDMALVGTHLITSANQGYVGLWSIFASNAGAMDWRHFQHLRAANAVKEAAMAVAAKPQLLWMPDHSGLTLAMHAIKVRASAHQILTALDSFSAVFPVVSTLHCHRTCRTMPWTCCVTSSSPRHPALTPLSSSQATPVSGILYG